MTNGNGVLSMVERVLAPVLAVIVTTMIFGGVNLRDAVRDLHIWKDETHPLQTELAHEQILTTVRSNQMELEDLRERIRRLE